MAQFTGWLGLSLIGRLEPAYRTAGAGGYAEGTAATGAGSTAVHTVRLCCRRQGRAGVVWELLLRHNGLLLGSPRLCPLELSRFPPEITVSQTGAAAGVAVAGVVRIVCRLHPREGAFAAIGAAAERDSVAMTGLPPTVV